jgi:hypothetical protein
MWKTPKHGPLVLLGDRSCTAQCPRLRAALTALGQCCSLAQHRALADCQTCTPLTASDATSGMLRKAMLSNWSRLVAPHTRHSGLLLLPAPPSSRRGGPNKKGQRLGWPFWPTRTSSNSGSNAPRVVRKYSVELVGFVRSSCSSLWRGEGCLRGFDQGVRNYPLRRPW